MRIFAAMNFLTAATIQAVQSLYGQQIDEKTVSLQETRKEFDGQITLVTFALTKVSRKSPEQTGEELGAFLLSELEEVVAYNVIKGFLNISLSDSFWIGELKDKAFPVGKDEPASNGIKVMVEFSSPNTNKPLHLGHVRNNLLGDSVSTLLKEAGYEVIKTNLVNDRGIHICKSMLAWQLFGNGETPESCGMKGDKLVGKYYVEFDRAYKKEIEELTAGGMELEAAKRNAPLMLAAQDMLRRWESDDKEVRALWADMNGWVYAGFDESYRRMGISFDKIYYESDTYLLGKDLIQEGLDMGVFFRKEDQSVWIDLTDEGLDQKLVLRGDGTSVYITQDIGTAQLKYEDFGMQRSIYVVGNEQDYHFKVLFLILKKLGKEWASGLFHLSYGMVDLPSGKMKSREGTVVDADDLMAEMVETARQRTEQLGKIESFSEAEKRDLYEMIGLGALKYFLLKVEPKKRLLFDPNESVDFQGHTGPFIQYTHARIQSVLQKGAWISGEEKVHRSQPLEDVERDLIQELVKYQGHIASAAAEYSPALVANYAYDLAKLYNKFYHELPILKAEEEDIKAFRLTLSAVTARIISRLMGILGIRVPDRM